MECRTGLGGTDPGTVSPWGGWAGGRVPGPRGCLLAPAPAKARQGGRAQASVTRGPRRPARAAHSLRGRPRVRVLPAPSGDRGGPGRVPTARPPVCSGLPGEVCTWRALRLVANTLTTSRQRGPSSGGGTWGLEKKRQQRQGSPPTVFLQLRLALCAVPAVHGQEEPADPGPWRCSGAAGDGAADWRGRGWATQSPGLAGHPTHSRSWSVTLGSQREPQGPPGPCRSRPPGCPINGGEGARRPLNRPLLAPVNSHTWRLRNSCFIEAHPSPGLIKRALSIQLSVDRRANVCFAAVN